MKITADESVDAAIVRGLRAEGHDVVSVAECDPGIDDDEVLRRAAADGRLLVTADKDFGELVYRLGRAHAGVVLLRLAGRPTEERADIVRAAVRAHGPEMPDFFSVSTPNTIRIRPRLSGS